VNAASIADDVAPTCSERADDEYERVAAHLPGCQSWQPRGGEPAGVAGPIPLGRQLTRRTSSRTASWHVVRSEAELLAANRRAGRRDPARAPGAAERGAGGGRPLPALRPLTAA